MFSTHAGTRHKLQRSPILVSAHRFAIAQFGAGRTPSMRGTPVPPHGPAAIRRVALRTTTKSKRWLLLCESRRSRRTIGLRLGSSSSELRAGAASCIAQWKRAARGGRPATASPRRAERSRRRRAYKQSTTAGNRIVGSVAVDGGSVRGEGAPLHPQLVLPATVTMSPQPAESTVALLWIQASCNRLKQASWSGFASRSSICGGLIRSATVARGWRAWRSRGSLTSPARRWPPMRTLQLVDIDQPLDDQPT